MRLGIIGAMEVEVDSIRRRLEGARRHEAARLELWEGKANLACTRDLNDPGIQQSAPVLLRVVTRNPHDFGHL